MEKLNLIVVFLEGLLSFFSPCILPILPIYLSMLSNSDINSLRQKNENVLTSPIFRNTIFFTLGISTTFFILGSSISALSSFINTNKGLIMIIGGLVIIFMGMFYMGIIKLSILNREKRINMKVKKMNVVSAYLLGFTFSFGWTPCIGPILSSVLIMASSADSSIMSNALILMYTVGFILPFLVASMFYDKLFKVLDRIKLNMETIKKIGGVIIILSGIIMIIGGFKIAQEHKNISENNKVNTTQSELDKSNESSESTKEIKAIDFVLYDQYGNEQKLSDYKGKTVFLNFWATWCPPCKEEMPYIEELYNEYNLNKEDVVILGVASPNLGREGSKEDIIKFLEDENYTFPVVFDNQGHLAYQYGINAFPTTFVIDKDGNIKQYVPGGMNKETMEYLIESVKGN